MKLVITGGHLAPALAVMEALPKQTEVLIIGRKHTFEGDSNLSFEYKTADALQIPFVSIITGRLQRTFTRYTIPSLLKLPVGFFQSFRILKDFKPDLVLSFGSYVSLPVVITAAILKIPIIVHEQTLTAGFANKIASIFAKKICISWETSKKYFLPRKTVFTGNPVRKFNVGQLAIGSEFGIPKGKDPLIYITGGSAGSHTINLLLEGCIGKLLNRFRIIHQIGDSWDFRDYDRLEKFRDTLTTTLKDRYIISKFVDSAAVGSIITASDLVVSRCGINTVTELLYFGKPALLIPLNSEQRQNALFFASFGLGQVTSQNNLTVEKLYKLIVSMVKDKDAYVKNGAKAKKAIQHNASQKIIDVINSFV